MIMLPNTNNSLEHCKGRGRYDFEEFTSVSEPGSSSQYQEKQENGPFKSYGLGIGCGSPMAGSTAMAVPVSEQQETLVHAHIPPSIPAEPTCSPESIHSSTSEASNSPADRSNFDVSLSDIDPTRVPNKTRKARAEKQYPMGKSRPPSKQASLKNQSLSPQESERKRYMNRLYAQKSREKKSNEIKSLKERCEEQEAIIEIYKKALSILHARGAGVFPSWAIRRIEWYPSQASRHKPPTIVDCLLPDCDEKFFAELGNSAYGQLYQPRPGSSTATNAKPTPAITKGLVLEGESNSQLAANFSKGNDHSHLADQSTTNNQLSKPILCQASPSTDSQSVSLLEQVLMHSSPLETQQTRALRELHPCSSLSRPGQSQVHRERYSPYKRAENMSTCQIQAEVLPADIRKGISEAQLKQASENKGFVLVISEQPHNLGVNVCSTKNKNIVGKSVNTATSQKESNNLKQTLIASTSQGQMINSMKVEQMPQVSTSKLHTGLSTRTLPHSQYSSVKGQIDGSQTHPEMSNQVKIEHTTVPSPFKVVSTSEALTMQNLVSSNQVITGQANKDQQSKIVQSMSDTLQIQNVNGIRSLKVSNLLENMPDMQLQCCISTTECENQTTSKECTLARENMCQSVSQTAASSAFVAATTNIPASSILLQDCPNLSQDEVIQPDVQTHQTCNSYNNKIPDYDTTISSSPDKVNNELKATPAVSLNPVPQPREKEPSNVLQNHIPIPAYVMSSTGLELPTPLTQASCPPMVTVTASSTSLDLTRTSDENIVEIANVATTTNSRFMQSSPRSSLLLGPSCSVQDLTTHMAQRPGASSSTVLSLLFSKPLPHTLSIGCPQTAAAEQRGTTSPSDSTDYLLLLNSTSTLSSLGSIDLETDHVELENLKATLLDHT